MHRAILYSFEAGNCVSNVRFKWMTIITEWFTTSIVGQVELGSMLWTFLESFPRVGDEYLTVDFHLALGKVSSLPYRRRSCSNAESCSERICSGSNRSLKYQIHVQRKDTASMLLPNTSFFCFIKPHLIEHNTYFVGLWWDSIKYTIHTPFNPFSPHDALKHHFTSMKTDLISENQGFKNENFHETGLPMRAYFVGLWWGNIKYTIHTPFNPFSPHDFLSFLNHIKSNHRELLSQFSTCSGWRWL